MSFLIDLFKKATKGDAFRPSAAPDKYSDQIAAMNAGGSSVQGNNKITTPKLAKLSNTATAGNSANKIPSA
jgi:hypothetical protein